MVLIVDHYPLAYSQVKPQKEVHIGEKVPDITLTGFYDDTLKKVPLSSLYKHKLLILDFWASWCAPCLDAFKEMDSIKTEFGDKIELVAVGYERYSTINKLFARQPDVKPNTIPILTNDKRLSYDYFPHRGLPHLVWIDSTGKVITITGGENLTVSNIKKFFNDGTLSVHPKLDVMQFSPFKPFHLRDSSYMGRSIFTNHTDGILSYTSVMNRKSKQPFMIDRIFATNISIRDLYHMGAFNNQLYIHNYGRMVFEIKDSLKYMSARYAPETFKKSKYFASPDKNLWEYENTYCYELEVPELCSDTVLFKTMIADLNRNLNLTGRFENRKSSVYVLQYHKTKDQYLNRSTSVPNIVYKAGRVNLLQAQNIKTLVSLLNKGINSGLIVDRTGKLDKELFDFQIDEYKLGITSDQINTMLSKYGLYLSKSKMVVPVFVVSEKE